MSELRNNNKAYPNNFFGYVLSSDTQTWPHWYFCNTCKKLYNHSTNGSQNLWTHIKDDHGYTDAG